ncbi:MAG: malate synthase G, partial [Novosphingobium sp.]|nr:malate synthase G [Novosphingobium sp.]
MDMGEMNGRIERSGLQVDAALGHFIDSEVVGPLGLDVEAFWQGFAALVGHFAAVNAMLLGKRDALQALIDSWHHQRKGKPIDMGEYRAFLSEIGYLVAEPEAFAIGTQNVDREIACMAGPQLVVPVLNDRFVLNAANARWGSLYDAWYGTDALDAPPAVPGGYDAARGAAVVRAGRAFLDLTFPLDGMSWADWDGAGLPRLCHPEQYAGQKPGALLLCNNGLHVEIVQDRSHQVGKDDIAGIADIVMEAALTAIVDLEDSVAAVDAEDKLLGYRNWLGLM